MEKNAGRKKQRGSFLLITMIVMLVMVFSGLFVMEMSMLEEITVSNEQRTVEVYQVANSELDAQLSFLEANSNLFNNALAANQTLTPVLNPGGCGVAGQVCQNVTLRFMGQVAPPPGFSFTNFVGLSFEINSVATLDGTGARSDQTLGVIFVAAR